MKLLDLLSYPRSFVMVIAYIPFLIFCSSASLLYSLVGRRDLQDQLIQFWGKGSIWMFGVDVVVTGKKPVGGCLYLFNHTSFFDIFVMHASIPGFRFGAKIELFSIPIFGRAMRMAGALPIARARREEVFRVYKEAEERARAGEQFALAPEGTRQDEEVLGPFKAGPFVFAINSGIPVVPVVIRNATQVLSRKSYFPNLGQWKRTIHIHILEPRSVSGYKTEDRPQLQALVKADMSQFIPIKK
jgi:1-acyl-sn-glycerol-3-phosphate acyltransferase